MTPDERAKQKQAREDRKDWDATVHPSNRIATILRAVKKARNFPVNTCGASRHVQLMAECLIKYGYYTMVDEEPIHVASSMLSTVTSLYEARTELAALKKRRSRSP